MENKYNLNTALVKRFLRTYLPQLPALMAVISGWKPEWIAGLSLLGALATTIDKWARQTNWYDRFGI